MQSIIAFLGYPGLLFIAALTVVFSMLVDGRVARGSLRGVTAPQALLAATSVLLVTWALVLLPWPLHPATGWPWIGQLGVLWALFEGAFLLPLVPALRAEAPLVARAASREAQIGVAGRAVVWLAVGAGLAQAGDWSLLAVPGRGLMLVAGLLAFPAAAGLGVFAAERSLTLSAAEEGLSEGAKILFGWMRMARAAGVLAALIVGSLAGVPTRPLFALILALALLLVVGLVLRRQAEQPRQTLPNALRWCWWRALPLALVGIGYLGIVGAQ